MRKLRARDILNPLSHCPEKKEPDFKPTAPNNCAPMKTGFIYLPEF